MPLGVRDDGRIRARTRSGNRDAHVHARGRAGEQVASAPCCPRRRRRRRRVRPCEPPLVLADREQVGEQLARVEVVGERVDDGHAWCRPPSLRGPPARRCARRSPTTMPLEHARGVGRGLLAAELAVRGRDDQRAAAEVGDADREAHARAGGRLVEDDGDGLRAGEGLRAPAVLLHLDGQVEDLGLLGRGEVVVAEEVAGHGISSGGRRQQAARAAPKRSANSAISASPTMSGGAMRMRGRVDRR